MDCLVLEKAISLAKLSKIVSQNKKEACLSQAQDLLLEYLETHPQDTNAWLLLTRLECNAPFYDPERIIKYTSMVLSYDKGNVYALLFLSYADYYLLGGLDDGLIDQLSQAKSDDKNLLSLIEIAKARFWEFRKKEEYEKCLLKSIELCKDYVANYAMLGKIYINRGRYSEGILLIKRALLNKSRQDYDIDSPADINGWLQYFFANAESIGEELCAFVNEHSDV